MTAAGKLSMEREVLIRTVPAPASAAALAASAIAPGILPDRAWTRPRLYLWPPGSSGGSSGAAISCHCAPASLHRREQSVGRLERSERHRQVEVRDVAELGAPVALDAARQVAGDAYDGGAAQPRQVLRRGLVEAALEARSEQRIEQQRCRLGRLGQRLHRALPLCPRRLCGFARRLGERGDPHLDAAFCEVARGDIAV